MPIVSHLANNGRQFVDCGSYLSHKQHACRRLPGTDLKGVKP